MSGAWRIFATDRPTRRFSGLPLQSISPADEAALAELRRRRNAPPMVRDTGPRP